MGVRSLDMEEIIKSLEPIIQFVFLPYIFPLYFAAIWIAVGYSLSKMSGWSELSEKYVFSNKFDGKYYRYQSAKFNKINFNNALQLGVNNQGMYLATMILFRLFHKPLFIPWNEIQAEPYKRLFFKGYRLKFNLFPNIEMKINGRTYDKMSEYLKTASNHAV